MTEVRPHCHDCAERVNTVEVIERRWLSKKAFEIHLTRPASFQFNAGQTIRFIHGDVKRYYSIISSPDEPALTLCIRHIPGGAFSTILASAKIGTHFEFTGPHGYFTFLPSQRPPVFVATGTGIAPFVSMGRSGVRNFSLLHGVSHPDDLYYRPVFSNLNISYVPCISTPVPEDHHGFTLYQGQVTQYIHTNLKRGAYDFYLCGREEMTRDVTNLVDDCFPGSFVFTEVFS
jgi:benzoate/toluate 1,2-dioxygenase reductase subunit